MYTALSSLKKWFLKECQKHYGNNTNLINGTQGFETNKLTEWLQATISNFV